MVTKKTDQVKDKAMIHWDTLYKKEAPKLIGVCRRYVGSTSDAEDIVHDSFLTAIEKADQFKGKGSIEAWIYKIVVNAALQHLKRNRAVQVPLDRIFDLSEPEANHEDTGSARKMIEEAGFSAEDLLAALDHLPEHHRVVFNMYVMEGYKHKNIAKILGISVGTSKSHLSRARKKLMQLLSSKAEQKKKRKRAIALLLFPGSGSYIDALYRKKFRNFRIPPRKKFVAKGISMPYKTGFSLFKTPFIYLGAAGLITLSMLVVNHIIPKNPRPGGPGLKKNTTEEIRPVRKINGTIPMDTKAVLLKVPGAENKPDTIRVIVRKPVYIRKTVVVKDTIRQTK